MFDLAIVGKRRGCDVLGLKVEDVAPHRITSSASLSAGGKPDMTLQAPAPAGLDVRWRAHFGLIVSVFRPMAICGWCNRLSWTTGTQIGVCHVLRRPPRCSKEQTAPYKLIHHVIW